MLLLSRAATLAPKPDEFVKIYSSMRTGMAISGLSNRGCKDNQRIIAAHGDGVCSDSAAYRYNSMLKLLSISNDRKFQVPIGVLQ